MSDDTVASNFTAQTRAALDQERRRIRHCLRQLSEEQVWQRPSSHVNCAGAIILHLCGNLRQWFLHGIAGEPDIRNRPAEFAETERIPKELLLEKFVGLVDQIQGVLDKTTVQTLVAPCRIQGCDTNGLAAIYQTVNHFEGHALQIAYITHLWTGEHYEPFWKPENKEQGAKVGN